MRVKIILLTFFTLASILKSQTQFVNTNPFPLHYFIENKGQFNSNSEFSAAPDFELNDKGSNWVEQKVPGSDLLPFLGCDEIMSGSNQRSSSILFHRTVPKFGLFAVSCDPLTGFAIQNEFDFSGYTGQKNPKYYEKRILFSGDFTGKGKNELLIISSNCGDANFNGYKCNVPDFASPFPPVSYIITIN